MIRELVVTGNDIQAIGELANRYASENVFENYRARRALNTLLRQKYDLILLSTYLGEAGITVSCEQLLAFPMAWSILTYGLVEGYVRWQLAKGYAIGAINARLSTVKVYCRLACQAGALSVDDERRIHLVRGFSHHDGSNVDKRRPVTSKGVKKHEPVVISKEQATRLKREHPDTPQGKRDALLMCLLLDHGLRCGEVVALKLTDFNITDGTLTFYREKVDITQTHMLTVDTLVALMRYCAICTPVGTLLMGSRRDGRLRGQMNARSVTGRVCELGKRLGITAFSAHDCRHYWATSAVRGGTDTRSLQQAGGWKSPTTALGYAAFAEVANAGVTLG
jgi:integrase